MQNLWYGCTRGNSFLQTPSQSLTGKQENPSLSTSRHINKHNNLNVCLFLDFELQLSKSKEFNNKPMKLQVKRALKGFFCNQKSNKKANKLCMKFSSTSNIVHDLEPKK